MNSGYSFQMRNEEIDSKSCEIKRYRINLAGSYTIKESLNVKILKMKTLLQYIKINILTFQYYLFYFLQTKSGSLNVFVKNQL